MPFFALSFTGISVISSPLNIIFPDVTVYPGLPVMAYPSVDFPVPLGPISTWVSSSPIVRLTP